MDGKCQMRISNIPEISAIYFALLQCGYDYYAMERSQAHNSRIQAFSGCKMALDFFSGVKQNTCQAYPYWPRAAILESAVFYLSPERSRFQDYDAFRECIARAGNIADDEKDARLWAWMEDFPKALCAVLASGAFHRYLAWEDRWIAEQNTAYAEQLRQVRSCLDACISRYGSPVQEIQIVLNPIKCVYSADYHRNGGCFIFSSGTFRVDSVIHEFLHQVVHPLVLQIGGIVCKNSRRYPGVDASYYLSENAAGQINAFEEFCVRQLTRDMISMNYPEDLTNYLKALACG